MQLTCPYKMCMKASLGGVRLNLCVISLLRVVGLNKYSPELFSSTSLLPFPKLFPASLPTVPVLPSVAFHLLLLHIPFQSYRRVCSLLYCSPLYTKLTQLRHSPSLYQIHGWPCHPGYTWKMEHRVFYSLLDWSLWGWTRYSFVPPTLKISWRYVLMYPNRFFLIVMCRHVSISSSVGYQLINPHIYPTINIGIWVLKSASIPSGVCWSVRSS